MVTTWGMVTRLILELRAPLSLLIRRLLAGLILPTLRLRSLRRLSRLEGCPLLRNSWVLAISCARDFSPLRLDKTLAWRRP